MADMAPKRKRARKLKKRKPRKARQAKKAAVEAAQQAPSEPAIRKVAVMPLGALGISSAMLKNLEMLLHNSIATIDEIEVIPGIDVQVAIQKNLEVSSCGGGPKCAVILGRATGADAVIFGNIGALGQAFNLSLRAVRTSNAKEIGRQQTSVSGNRDLLIPELRLAAYKLIAPNLVVGSLLIEIDVVGVEIEIDGKIVGITPLKKPVENLKPGDHVVVLKRPGYSQFQKEFTIKPFETARLKLDLQAAQADPDSVPAPEGN